MPQLIVAYAGRPSATLQARLVTLSDGVLITERYTLGPPEGCELTFDVPTLARAIRARDAVEADQPTVKATALARTQAYA